jgi:tetraacyldisaccharide 4'-kinase
MREPAFWRHRTSAAARLLAPAAACYGAVAAWRLAQPGRRALLPIICVGNFTLGGAGKTPAAIAVAKLMIAAGRRPFFLSRGYGGLLGGPVQVDTQPADQVGDEPLLLARVAPTIVSRDRPAGAAAAARAGADLVIMDDGLQNPSLAKDFSIAVVDTRSGIGNGRVFPAGPLRAPLEAQLDRVDAVLLVGAAGAASDHATTAARRRGLPIFHGELRPDPQAAAALSGRPVLAFAGIADPGKFFATLESCGIIVAARKGFPDHHRYTAGEIAGLLAGADRDELDLVTTEKDWARMNGDPAAAGLAARAHVLPVILALRPEDKIGPTLLGAITARRRRAAALSRTASDKDA